MLGESEERTYLNVSYGKLRQRAKEGQEKAKSRTLEDGTVIWEKVYNFLEGIIDKIFMKTHEEYGNSWLILMSDGEEKFSIQVSENSRYGDDLLKKIPNLNYGRGYKITPYDFEADGKRKCGISIKTLQSDLSVISYYHTFGKNPDGSASVTATNGFLEYDGNWKDKDEVKIYFMRVRKFLREKSLEYLEKDKSATTSAKAVTPGVESGEPFIDGLETPPPPTDEDAPPPNKGDAPF